MRRRRQSKHGVEAWLEEEYSGRDLKSVTEIQNIPGYLTGSLDKALAPVGPALLVLNLSGCRSFTGTLTVLSNCKGLISLNLCNCDKLTGTLDALNNCVALTNINIGNCQNINGSLDPLAVCTKLTSVDVFGCKSLTGTLDSLSNCTALTKVNWSSFGTAMKTIGNLDGLANCTALTSIDLEYCRSLIGTLISLRSCTALTNINVGDCNKLSGPLPGNIISLLSEGKANLKNCRGPFTIDGDLNDITDIVSVDLRPLGSRLRGSLEGLRTCTALTSLDIEDCESLSGNLDALSACTALMNLNARGCSGLSGNLNALSNCVAMANIVFHGCGGLVGNLEGLRTCTALASLELENCESLSGNLDALSTCTALTNLSARGCSGLTGTLDALENCTALMNLVFHGCGGLVGSLEGLRMCTALASLDLAYCTSLSGTLDALATCTALTNLSARGCSGLTGTLDALQNCTALEDLDLECCGKIKGSFGGLIPLQSLAKLNLQNCIELDAIPTADTVALVCNLRSTGSTVQLPSIAVEKHYENADDGCLDFRPFSSALNDSALLSLEDRIGSCAKSLNLSGCLQLTDESIRHVIGRCTSLVSLNILGTQATAPFSIQKNAAALRRYYLHLAMGTVTCTKLKVVLMGKSHAGKTSLLRALKAIETGEEQPELPDIGDRTIGVETSLLFDKFSVHDFSGQREYQQLQKSFLSRGALYLMVADLSEGVKECCTTLEEQLSTLFACAPGSVALIVLTKTEAGVGRPGSSAGRPGTSASTGRPGSSAGRPGTPGGAGYHYQQKNAEAELAAAVQEIEERLIVWRDLKHLRREEGVAPIKLMLPVHCTSAVTMRGVPELQTQMLATANTGRGDGDNPSQLLFPKFGSPVPMVYEKLRSLVDALRTGQHHLANAVITNFIADESSRTKKHFIRFSKLLGRWKEVVLEDEALDQVRSEAEQIFHDALKMLEGEGVVLHSKRTDLVHLNPAWLASCIRPLADPQMHSAEWRQLRVITFGDWILEEDAIELLERYAEMGITTMPNLLRELLQEDVLDHFKIGFEVVVQLLEEQSLLFPLQRPPSRPSSRAGHKGGGTGWKVPFHHKSAKVAPGSGGVPAAGWVVHPMLPDGPRHDATFSFAKACALQEGDSAWEVTGTFGLFYLPEGLVQATLAALNRQGQDVEFYRQGGMVTDVETGMKFLLYFDIMDFRVILRVQGEAKFSKSMRIHLVAMMHQVDEVASAFGGLNLVFDYEPNEVVDIDIENKRVAPELREQKEFRDKVLTIEATTKRPVSRYRERVELIQLLKRRVGHVKQSDEIIYADAFGALGASTENLLEKCRHLAADYRGHDVHQSGHFFDADSLLAGATEAQPILIEGMRSALSSFEGCEFVACPLKPKDRIIEKAKKDYRGNVKKVVDVVRASALFSYPTDLTAFVKKIATQDKNGAGMVVLRVKDRFNSPLNGGYRDVLLNVRVSGCHMVAELTLHIKKLKAIKPKAPRIYQVMRSFGWEETHAMN